MSEIAFKAENVEGGLWSFHFRKATHEDSRTPVLLSNDAVIII